MIRQYNMPLAAALSVFLVQRRSATACIPGPAMVVKPKVILFDEPLSRMDARLRVEMHEEIKNIPQKTEITSIYVIHD